MLLHLQQSEHPSICDVTHFNLNMKTFLQFQNLCVCIRAFVCVCFCICVCVSTCVCVHVCACVCMRVCSMYCTCSVRRRDWAGWSLYKREMQTWKLSVTNIGNEATFHSANVHSLVSNLSLHYFLIIFSTSLWSWFPSEYFTKKRENCKWKHDCLIGCNFV